MTPYPPCACILATMSGTFPFTTNVATLTRSPWWAGKPAPNADGGGNSIYLDRHHVTCYNKAIKRIHLRRPSGNQINYLYRCGNTDLSNITEYTTPANNWGGGNAVYIDRHNIACPAGSVLSAFRLERPAHDTIRYRYSCGQQVNQQAQ